MKKRMKEKKRIRKRADLTAKTLVTIILLIIGFVIVLFLYYQIAWTGRVDREACHQSVIYRATLPAFAGIRDYVPLKCKVQKVCITTGLIGGKCEEFGNAKGVVKVKVKNKEQVERFIAQEMIDCWSMMGEGKVNVFGDWLVGYGIGKVGSSCVICDRIVFDKTKLEEAGIKVEEINVLEYMMTHAVPDKDISYYDYLTKEGGKASFEFGKEIEIVSMDKITVDENGKIKEQEGKKDNVSFQSAGAPGTINEIGIMFMQISAPRNSGVFRKNVQALVGGFGTSFVLAPHITLKALSNLYVDIAAVALIVGIGVYEQANTLNNRAITAGYCGDISVGTEARDGCSVVRMIDYNAEDLSKYCNIVESIS